MSIRVVLATIVAFCFGLILTSCSRPIAPPTAKPEPEGKVSLFDNTVGGIAELEGWASIPVKGYGIVMGLAGTGSRECPRQILEIIQAGTRGRTRPDGKPIFGDANLRELINSPNTAVVVLQGEIPPAAAAGDKIDLTVSTLPNTQTTSLAGGDLFVSELSIEAPTTSGTPVRTRPMALAGYPEPAPIFVNPFASDNPESRPVSLRSGKIIGGGQVLKSRPLRLVLRVPGGSARLVRQITERINFRFPVPPGEPATAEALDRMTVNLMIPREYQSQTRHFLMLVLQTSIFDDPVWIANWSEQLIAELAKPNSPAEQITAALESIGNSTVPALRQAYQSSEPRVRFYSARTAALLGDDQAVPVVSQFAAEDSSPYQLPATTALGELPKRDQSNRALRPLLDSENTLVRIRAYEFLAKNADSSVVPVSFTRPAEFGLDVVYSNGQPLIYVQTMKQSRIALFGESLRCEGSVFYLSGDKLVTITSAQADGQLSVLRCTPTSGAIGLKLQTSPDLISLIKTLGTDVEPDFQGIHHGLGLDYSQTVAALYGLWQSKAIRAGFVLQQPEIAREVVEQATAPVTQRLETSTR